MAVIPNVIYHYCGLSGLHGILQSKSLWLSDAYFMNDYMEHRLLLGKARTTVESLACDKSKKHYKQGSIMLTDLLDSPDKHPYICCFSREPDLLSQWRAYSDNGAGFAIGFSTKGLNKRCDEHKAIGLEFMLQPVEYKNARHDTMVEGIVSRYLAEWEEHFEAQHSARIMKLPWEWYCEIWRAAALCKNPGFEEEREYRIVLKPSAQLTGTPGNWVETVGCSKLAFRVSGNRLVPFYQFAFEVEDLSEIRVGPRFPDRDNHDAIRMFLKQNCYPRNIKIINSTVTYQ